MTLLIPDAPTLYLNARLIDGHGGEPVDDAAVLVEGNKISKVGKTADFGESPNGNMRVLDLGGKTLMPGLIEGHFHISFWGVRELPDLDLKLPCERTTVYAVKNAELALRCGYTGVASAGALYRIDVTIRDMVNEGIIPGPRMAASGRDICATSGMLDWNPSYWKLGMEGLSIFADGVGTAVQPQPPEQRLGRVGQLEQLEHGQDAEDGTEDGERPDRGDRRAGGRDARGEPQLEHAAQVARPEQREDRYDHFPSRPYASLRARLGVLPKRERDECVRTLPR